MSYFGKPVITLFRHEHFFLSNFYPIPIDYMGFKYPSVEHAFQALKCADDAEAKEILKTVCPAQVKKMGAKVRMRTDWEVIKCRTMRNLLNIKFKNKRLRKLLFKTKPSHLIEYNAWHDNFWGDCSCGRHTTAGRNQLGKMLMEIRDEIQQDEFATHIFRRKKKPVNKHIYDFTPHA